MNNPFDFFDKIFYINLKHRTDREQEALNEFKKFNINAERWEATRISRETSDGMTEAGFPLCDNTYPEDLDDNTLEKFKFVIIGQRSCALSHLNIIRYAKRHNLENVLIFEDDVSFNENVNIVEILENTLEELKNVDWDMFYLGTIRLSPIKKCGEYLGKLGICSATHSYAVNKKAYDVLLEYPFMSVTAIDTFYSKLSSLDKLNIYSPLTQLTCQSEGFSDIQGHKVGGLEPYIYRDNIIK